MADAGRPAAVTIATNMAGRGTDDGSLAATLMQSLSALALMTKVRSCPSREAWEKRHADVLGAGGEPAHNRH